MVRNQTGASVTLPIARAIEDDFGMVTGKTKIAERDDERVSNFVDGDTRTTISVCVTTVTFTWKSVFGPVVRLGGKLNLCVASTIEKRMSHNAKCRSVDPSIQANKTNEEVIEVKANPWYFGVTDFISKH